MDLSAPLAAARAKRTSPVRDVVRRVRIDVERCKGCGLCIDACAPHVLALDVGLVNAMGHHPVALVDPGGCTSCAKCARMCPDGALTILVPALEASA